MKRRIGSVLLLLFLLVAFNVSSAAAQKRRSVKSPGGSSGACGNYGVLDPDAFVSAMALDASFVYYIDDFDSILYRIPKTGGARTKLGEFPNILISAMTVDDTNVYLATIAGDFEATIPPGDIYAIPKAGGTLRTLASGVVYVTDMTADATHVYWVSLGTVKLIEEEILSDGKIERVTKDGATRQALATGLSTPVSLAIDDTNVYFGELGQAVGNPSMGLRRMAKSGGSVTHVLDFYRISYIVMSGNDLVFSGGSETTSGIFRVAKTGGTVQTLVDDPNIDSAPKIAGGQIYYITFPDEESDALMRVPITGGTPQLLRAANAGDSDFEVDDCATYIGANDGTLVRGTR